MPLETASVDIITIAQAFHWFSNSASLVEFARILKPDGHLVLIWNEQDENQGWVHDLVEFMWTWKDSAPQHRDMKWKDTLAEQTQFGPFRYMEFPNPLQADRASVIDRVFSTSFIAKQPEDQAKIIRDGVIAILDKHGVFPEGVTQPYPYTSQLHIAKKL
jgi:SAM-dependent methyltransferase